MQDRRIAFRGAVISPSIVDDLPQGTAGPWLRYVVDAHLAELRSRLSMLRGAASDEEIIGWVELADQPARIARAAGYGMLGEASLAVIEDLAAEAEALECSPAELLGWLDSGRGM